MVSAQHHRQFQLDSQTGGRYWIQVSTSLAEWSAFVRITNSTGTGVLTDAKATPSPRKCYRAKQ